MQKIEAIIRPEKLDDVKNALAEAGFTGMNIVHVTGRGVQRGIVHMGRGGESYTVDMLPKVKVEVVVSDTDSDRVVKIICDSAATGTSATAIFIMPVMTRSASAPASDESRLGTVAQGRPSGRTPCRPHSIINP
jgi:nitrogen regulatory protein P-II 1